MRGCRKLDEVPYDFLRKRLSVLVERRGTRELICKGALGKVLDVCSRCRSDDGEDSLTTLRPVIDGLFAELSAGGYRVLGLALRDMGAQARAGRDDEHDMTFVGLLVFEDPPKAGAADTIRQLGGLGVTVKMVTGDNALAAAAVGAAVGLSPDHLLTSKDVAALSDEALRVKADETAIYAEIEPSQKERIVRALQRAGRVVGYMGDGINDAAALHAADAGVSVDSAVDVAKQAADFVLLDKDLDVLTAGIQEGRRTFANTLKYVFMATSANFGNMFSMAGASLFLGFLPLLPSQILLMSLITDIPEMTIAGDSVDPEAVAGPRRWDIRFIRRFMLVFGLLSSVFDYATLALLLLVLHAGQAEFRTGWFMESVASAALIVLVIRTRRVFFRSRPSRWLLLATALAIVAAVALPLTPLGPVLGFTPVPAVFFAALAGILMIYVLAAEIAKRRFYRRA